MKRFLKDLFFIPKEQGEVDTAFNFTGFVSFLTGFLIIVFKAPQTTLKAMVLFCISSSLFLLCCYSYRAKIKKLEKEIQKQKGEILTVQESHEFNKP